MSRSRWKSSTDKGAFMNCVCYFSNKISKRLANRAFRNKSKAKLRYDLLRDNLENHTNYIKIQEVSDNWDFSSDGLKYYILFKDSCWYTRWSGPWTQEEIDKFKRK